MKKRTICILLCVVLLAGACPIAASGEGEEKLSFAVASDLHYNLPRENLEGEIDDSIYWYANRRAAMEDESGLIIDEFLAQCAESDCEYVLVSGDLVDNGRVIEQEHYDVAAKLARFEAETGKDVFVINGNHDLGEGAIVDIERFKDIYADFGYDKALSVTDYDCSYAADLADDYRLIALDSCDPTVSTADGMSIKKINWVIEQCDRAKADGRYVILMMHHNLLDHLPMQRLISRNFIIRAHLTTAELFANLGVKIVLTGHEHCSDATSYTSTLGNVIYDFATSSLTMYPLTYRMFTLTPDEITYTAQTIDSIDTDALTRTVAGYSAEQTALMNDGFNSYAKGFLKAGVRYRLELSLSMEKIGIDEDAVYYDLVNTAVGKLTDLLKMPLYGENSVESKAAAYGINLPETNYKNGWDLATEFVAAHYEGSEEYSLEGADIKTLLLTVAVLLRDEFNCVDSYTLTGAAEALLASFGMTAEKEELEQLADVAFLHPITPAEYFTVALISPLLYEFISDSDGVDDNNGTLPGYGCTDLSANATNIANNIQGFFLKLIARFRLMAEYIKKIFMPI